MSKAQGQFTIVDLNDAVTLTGFINSNLAKTQMYNPDNDTYTPDWSSTNLVLTPSIYVAGTSTDKITSTEVISVKWYEGSSTTAITSAGNYALSGTKSHILTVKGNVMAGLPGKDFRVEIQYKDPATGLTTMYKTSISFSRVVNGSGITDLLVMTPNGNIFKNGQTDSLTAAAQLWRGSAVDTTNVTYQWYQMDSSVDTDQGGGIGWKKLANASGQFSGVTTSTLTIYAGQVDSSAVFKCVAKDTDSASATYNQTFSDTASFVDLSDPIQVIIESTGGDAFKNGEGSTVLTARVYQAGEEIDTAGEGTYTWSKYDKNGQKVASFSKTGKTLSVGSSDVDVKGTFICVVEI